MTAHIKTPPTTTACRVVRVLPGSAFTVVMRPGGSGVALATGGGAVPVALGWGAGFRHAAPRSWPSSPDFQANHRAASIKKQMLEINSVGRRPSALYC